MTRLSLFAHNLVHLTRMSEGQVLHNTVFAWEICKGDLMGGHQTVNLMRVISVWRDKGRVFIEAVPFGKERKEI